MADDFDVFLSHNSKDKPAVRQIAGYLEECGLRPWLDEDELRPGLPWQDGLQEAIRASKAAAVFLGPHDFGNWERPEIRALLQRMVDHKLPVIPVLLPGTPEKPDLGIYLEQNTWVDLRSGLVEKELERLVWGITDKKPEKRKPLKRPGPPLHNLPFPPLGDLLKGRDEELRRLQAALDKPGEAAAITQSEAISGLGGIGKTRLAVEHAWRCGDRYTAAWFVRADSPEGLRRGLATLAGPALLNLPE
ncbi:MAG TPA: toll/interleukin-1 receptor domain-containing protein, partial [Thermoanaerobaculia bacterium]